MLRIVLEGRSSQKGLEQNKADKIQEIGQYSYRNSLLDTESVQQHMSVRWVGLS